MTTGLSFFLALCQALLSTFSANFSEAMEACVSSICSQCRGIVSGILCIPETAKRLIAIDMQSPAWKKQSKFSQACIVPDLSLSKGVRLLAFEHDFQLLARKSTSDNLSLEYQAVSWNKVCASH
jgi:hypothetical protein